MLFKFKDGKNAFGYISFALLTKLQNSFDEK